jgi:hypothetical protein
VVQNAQGINTDLHPITINTSFEYQKLNVGAMTSAVDGWTTIGAGVRVANLTAASANAKFNGPIPDGSQLVSVTNSALYQFTGTTVQPGTYHMTLKTASGKDNAQVGTFLTGFMVAGNNIATVSDLTWDDTNSYTAGPGLTAGAWTTIDIDWVVRSDSLDIGKYLYINYWATSNNTMYFDNVNISFTPVPEPSTVVMLAAALIAFVARAWKKRRTL